MTPATVTREAGAAQLTVGGHSAGGGMSAAITLKARDTADVDIALQLPVYQMLDDRRETTSSRFSAPLYDAAEGIPVSFAVFGGCFHGFDFFQRTDVARQAGRVFA